MRKLKTEKQQIYEKCGRTMGQALLLREELGCKIGVTATEGQK